MKASDLKAQLAAITARIERLEANQRLKPGRKRGTGQTEETKAKIAAGMRRFRERRAG